MTTAALSIEENALKGPTPWRTTYAQLLRSAGEDADGMRRSIIALMLAAALQGLAFACIVPLLQAVLSRSDYTAGWNWVGIMALVSFLSMILRWKGQSFDYDGRMAQATHRLRTSLGEQLRRMPLEQLQDKRAGELNAMVLGNVDENLSYTLMILNLIFVSLITPAFTALALLFVDWRMAVALMLLFPTIVPLYRWRRPIMGRSLRALAEANQKASGDVVEFLQGLPVLRAACLAGEKTEHLKSSFERMEQIQTVGQRTSAKPNLLVTGIVETGLLLVLGLGVVWVLNGSLDLATLAALCIITVRFADPMATFISYTVILELSETALKRIEALMAVKPLPQLQASQLPDHYDIRFEGVQFQYAQGDTPSIINLNADIPARSLTALVGPSGSGKTTLTRLLMRQADPQEGRILIGGVDLRQIPPEELQSLVSVVFQDVYLFDDTVLANIRMARPDADEDEIIEAARAARCTEFIERLPQGWNTRLGEIGGRLSGGERQRISIARALLKNAPIVVLDEPTAALDTESELSVQQAIDALVREKTVIVIAHRLSTIAAAERILVIDAGRLVEQGNHTELLASNGRYRAMWEAQTKIKDWHLTSGQL